MRRSLPVVCAVALVGGAALLSEACGYGAGDPDVADADVSPSDAVDDGTTDAEDAVDDTSVEPAFAQPGGLAVVGLDPDGVTTVYHATVGGPGDFRSFRLPASASTGPGLVAPTIERVTPSEAKPLTQMVLTGARFTTHPDAAISVVFEADGLVPVAVPVLIATETSLAFAAPVLLGSDGLDARGTATVRVVEILGGAHAVSAPFGTVVIERVPPIEGRSGPAGMLAAAFLLDAAEFALDSLEAAALPMPSELIGDVNRLADQLEATAVAIQQAALASPPTVSLPWSDGAVPALDAETLDFLDRLAFHALRTPIAAIQADVDAAARADGARPKVAPYGCPELEGTPEQQMESMLCMHHGHPAAMARVGEPAVAAGFQVVTSVYTGFWGGSAAAVIGANSARAALVFEVVWSGLAGHLSAWVTGQRRPSAGQTLSDSGATLADRVLRTGGSLDTLWTMISFGRTYDRLVREAAATHGGDAGVDAGPDATPDVDAVTDAVDAEDDADAETDATGGRSYEGTATLYGDDIEFTDGCLGTPRVDLAVTVIDLSGSGTAANPYDGEVIVSGSLAAITAGPCGGTVALPPITGRIGGVDGAVGFDVESTAPPRYEVALTRGVVEGATRTLTGEVTVSFWPEGRFWFGVDGTLELSEVE